MQSFHHTLSLTLVHPLSLSLSLPHQEQGGTREEEGVEEINKKEMTNMTNNLERRDSTASCLGLKREEPSPPGKRRIQRRGTQMRTQRPSRSSPQ